MIGIWESKEKMTASLPAIRANWEEVKDRLEGQPQIEEYPTAEQVKG
jgi:quinol monooxygenase YgiN